MYKNSFLVKFLERAEEEEKRELTERLKEKSPKKSFEYNEESKEVVINKIA